MNLTLAATLLTAILFGVFLIASEALDLSPFKPLDRLAGPCCLYGNGIDRGGRVPE